MQCLKYRAFSTPECANVLDGSINYTFILSSPSGTSHPSTGATPTYYSISEATSDARQAVRARYRGATTIRVAACRQVTSRGATAPCRGDVVASATARLCSFAS